MSDTRKSNPRPPEPAPAPAKGAAPAKPAAGEAKPVAGKTPAKVAEIGGPEGPEPTRFGDWERKGICVDF